MQANYTEDLSSPYIVTGGNKIVTTGTAWRTTADANNKMNKKTGHSTESNAYYTVNVTAVNQGDANSNYQFKLYKTTATTNYYGLAADGDQYYLLRGESGTAKTTSTSGKNVELRADALGEYELKVNYSSTPTLTVTYPTAYAVTFGKGTGGGTVTAKYSNTSFTSGTKVQSGKTVTFTQTAATGYTFSKWYTTSTGSGGTQLSTSATYDHTVSSTNNVYAIYTENKSDITIEAGDNGSITTPSPNASPYSLGVATKQAITATPDEGYYFAGWEVTGNAAVDNASAASTYAKTDGTDGGSGTVTATFLPLEKIYFRNIFDDGAGNVSRWSNVYVYFAITWDGGRVVTNSDASYKVAMTKIAGTDVYWAYVPRSFTTHADADLKKQVAFSDASYGTSYKFYHATASHDKAASRGDYNKALNMFVPHHIAKSTNTGNGGVDYFDNGYWMKYDTRASQGAGYYLKKYNSRNNYTQEGEFIATNDDADFIQFELRIDAANSTLNYMITSAGALNYVAASGVTAANCSNIALNENTQSLSDNDVKFSLKTASEGIYTFILDQSGDKMKLNVIYPVAVGDYVLIHDYNDGSAKSNHSDFIKASEVSGKTVSMYLNMDAGTKSLKLYKCTAITAAGKPVFGSSTTVGTGTGLFNTTTFDKGKGVYQFDVTIEEDEVATITNAGLYEGNYYIKTNCATGGWANYKQNIMVENSINASDFDYYYCKWVGDAGTNIKCVIANDYNNAVSDTLIGDATLGVGVQTLPRAGSVRFSYNSKTNTLDRAYISGSSDWETYFLELQAGSAVIKQRNGSTFTDNKTKFTDGGNWIYSLELQAQEGARIKLVSHYYTGSTTKSQYFKGAAGVEGHYWDEEYTELLIGDNGDATTDWQQLTIIYDFKTNNILSAWSPSGDITGTINLKTDVMLIHNRKKIANPAPTYVDEVSLINFTGNYELQHIDKVYSAFRFQKLTGSTDYVGLQETSANGAQSYYRYNYWISFPYDVKMTDIFGINGYGSKWRIQYYDGAERASKGWYKGDGVTSFWKTMPMSEDKKLNKGEGYVLQLSPSAFKATGSGSLWELSDEVYLYFPSKSNFGNITKKTSSVTLSELNCTKGDFTDGSGKSHNVTDSHWHVFGIPTFNDATGTTGTGHNYYDESEPEDEYPEDHNISGGIFYFYKYNNTANSSEYNTYTATSSEDFTFQPMHAYMIQMHGTLNFASNSVPASVAARQLADDKNYDAQIEILSDDIVHDQTFISMKDEAEVGFAFNEDLMKIHNDGKTNIYSYSGPYDVAANILPAESRTIALGVEVAEEGTYTFHMPSNFNGTVTLFDNVTNTRTNLALSDYEVSLNAGNYEGRFYLEIDLQKVTTSLDGLQGEGGNDVRKVMIDDIMYIIRDGKMYDARGARIE